MPVARTLGLVTAGALVAALAVTAYAADGDGGDPAGRAAAPPPKFDHPVANPWFPLKPGLVTRLRGTDEGKAFHEVVRVTHRTKRIEGVTTTVIRDVLRRADGSVAEKTHDWYAADNDGNVWYFGENTATFRPNGTVESREGSWQAGVDGAVAGTIMPANPHATDAYRQEFWRGHAEDQAWIVQKDTTVTVPRGTFHHVVRSFEWSRLEKANVSVKFYGRNVGIIAERDVAGGTEKFELVGVTRRNRLRAPLRRIGVVVPEDILPPLVPRQGAVRVCRLESLA